MAAGVGQFVLANTAPEQGLAFAYHTTRPPATTTARVVFHGTSLDRLYLILRHGLQPGAGKWSRHGALYGLGIYLADEPATALDFATLSRTVWPHSSLDTCKIVLGVELAGGKPAIAPGIPRRHRSQHRRGPLRVSVSERGGRAHCAACGASHAKCFRGVIEEWVGLRDVVCFI
jgi:hypothetical protein